MYSFKSEIQVLLVLGLLGAVLFGRQDLASSQELFGIPQVRSYRTRA